MKWSFISTTIYLRKQGFIDMVKIKRELLIIANDLLQRLSKNLTTEHFDIG